MQTILFPFSPDFERPATSPMHSSSVQRLLHVSMFKYDSPLQKAKSESPTYITHRDPSKKALLLQYHQSKKRLSIRELDSRPQD